MILAAVLCLTASMAMGQMNDFFITPTDSMEHEPMPTTLEGWARRLNTFGHYVPQEKVYVHMDNTCYFLGDTIWYAAYTRRTDSDVPSRISRVMYVELFNQDGYLVERQILEIKDGKGNGCFALPDTLYAGYYELRAYTRWQLNWGQYEHDHTFAEEELFYTLAMAKEFFRDYDKLYSRVFPVYDKPNSAGYYAHDMTLRPLRRYFKDELPPPRFHITLYPEGGTLVGDAPCRMAFEVSNEQGETTNGRCAIIDHNGQEVASARTQNRGRGLLQFTPKAGEAYKAYFYSDSTKANGDTIMVKAKLDKTPIDGISTILNIGKSDITLEVNARGYMAEKLFGYTIMHEGIVEEYGQLQGRHSTITIPRDELHIGVNQMTLFDEKGHIYADRLFFVSKPNLTVPNISINGVKQQYEPYEEISLEISLVNNTTMTRPSVSLAVRDATFTDQLYDNASIQVEMLLSSEIKGFVPNPAWFFEKDDEEHLMALDLLMLTQGWRRFNWREMATPGEFILTHPNEYSQVLEGSVHRYDTYDQSDFFSAEQMADRLFDQGLTREQIIEELEKEYGRGINTDFLNSEQWTNRYADAFRENKHRVSDQWTQPSGRRAKIPLERSGNEVFTFSNSRDDFSSQQQFDAGVETPQTRQKSDRPSWQRLISNTSKWKHEPVVTAEFTKPGAQPIVGETGTKNGLFRIQVPDIDGYCMMFLGAYDSTNIAQKEEKVKHKNAKRGYKAARKTGKPFLMQQQPDDDFGVQMNDFPKYYVRLLFPYPRFVKPYSWYQTHLAPMPEEKLRKQLAAGFAIDENMREIVVRSKRGGLRKFDASKPAFVLDAYEAFNATVDAGFNYGRYGADFPFNIAHTYISDMNMYRHYDISVRYDSIHATRNRSAYSERQYYLLKNLDKVCIYTDYSPRQEGSQRYMQTDQPNVEVNLIKFPNGKSRYHYVNRRFLLQGFNYPTEYYHVDYSKRKPTANETPDYRRTLYWNPDLQLDYDGHALIKFFNNSRNTTIETSVAGQAPDGTLLHQ